MHGAASGNGACVRRPAAGWLRRCTSLRPVRELVQPKCHVSPYVVENQIELARRCGLHLLPGEKPASTPATYPSGMKSLTYYDWRKLLAYLFRIK